jgi:molybdopterin adenylyltransferase
MEGNEAGVPIRTGILTLSDKGARGERLDTSGAAIRELMAGIGGTQERYAIIPDERSQIAETLRSWTDSGDLDLIITTGGTGLSPRDVTPDATAAVLDYQTPGLAEAMRAEGLRHTPMAMLSRAVCGVRGRTLIINLPGSEKGVRENLSVLLPVLPHAIETLRGAAGDHTAT